ncbi:MAG: alpha/beta hydrolase [Caldilineales bacterium]|nr:alpha/beta hydrolase [Caldilineales bacterium]
MNHLIRHADFPSRHILPRHVDVWLPPGYEDAPARRYPVIYMHDGQNLFLPELAFTGVDWGVDEAILALMQQEEGFAGAIVVGVWNTAHRVREYMPQQPAAGAVLARFRQQTGAAPQSDAYLRFLVGEVKSFIDATYRTQPGPDHTFVMGSSMGGLISLYALIAYPDVFGGAGCLSTHWPIGGHALAAKMVGMLPPPGSHRLYFDYGTAGLDAEYAPFQSRVDDLLAAAGWTHGQEWLTLKFDGAEHNEAAWRTRLPIPIRFLFGY